MTTDVSSLEAESPVAPEAEDRPAAGRARRRGPWLIGAAAAAGVTGWVLFASPLLAVDSVVVTGLGPVTQEQVLSAADIAPGTPMLTLNTSAAAERVSQLDAVASAEVTRQWPGSVAISVVPDAPVGTSQEGQQWVVWGAEGGQLAVGAEPPADVTQLRGISAESRGEALALLAALPADVRSRVAEVSWDERRGYLLTLRDGAGSVRWGDASESSVKATVLSALLPAAPDARWFDVSTPAAPRSAVAEPVARAREGAQAEGTDPEAPEAADSADPGAGEDAQEQTEEAQAPEIVEVAPGAGEQPRGLQPVQ